MLRVEHRKLFRPTGLIDDMVLYGSPADYVAFAAEVEAAISHGRPTTLKTESPFCIEIRVMGEGAELFTSLQNHENVYSSPEAWEERSVLRVHGSGAVLEALRLFLLDLSTRGEGYSYVSEYSKDLSYALNSPEWRLHVRGA